MDTFYWLWEYGKVLFAYGMLLFVWPMVVFRRFLKGRSFTVKFAFCVTGQIIVINTVVLGLGLCHILNDWTVRLFFYGTFLIAFFKQHHMTEEQWENIRRLFVGTQGGKLFLVKIFGAIGRWVKQKCRELWQTIRPHFVEYLLLTVVLVFGAIYFTYGAFQTPSYGFGDMYTHHAWIYGLKEGKIFSAGIYPEAMHCVVYSMNALFGVRVYSILLFLAEIHVVAFLLSFYCLMKDLFHWRFTPIFVLALFLTVDAQCIDGVFSISRLQWTLPQEFGLHTQFLCALFLYRYLKSEPGRAKNGKGIRLKDENLILFMLSLAASLAIHFYVTIMAFFLCAAVAMCLLFKVIHWRRFTALVAATLCGCLIAAAPMGIALATGMQFQGSIGWALNVINGTDEHEAQYRPKEDTTESSTGTQDGTQDATGVQDNAGAQGSTGTQDTTGTQGNTGTQDNAGTADGMISSPDNSAAQTSPKKSGVGERISTAFQKGMKWLQNKADNLYQHGYHTVYADSRAAFLVFMSLVGAALFVVYRLLIGIASLIWKQIPRKQRQLADGYPPVILASLFFMMIYAAAWIGLPSLIAPSRLCSTIQLLMAAVVLIPVDMAFSLLGCIPGKVFRYGFLYPLSVAFVGLIYVGTQYLGIYHSYLYYELTRYNSVVEVTNDIIEAYPQNSYTIISCTDELYQVIEYGRHEELLTFLQNVEDGRYEYTIPTKYLFLYVEKKPIQYAQSHFFSGPKWLALEKYPEFYSSFVSAGNEVNAGEVSAEMAARKIMTYSKVSSSYSNLESRTILQSKAYEWSQAFEKKYPLEMKVYYEDADFVCYIIPQNLYKLYSLEVQ